MIESWIRVPSGRSFGGTRPAFDDAKTACWKEQKQARSTAELLAMGAELFAYARGVRPDWPGAEDRAEDVAVHLRVSEALRAVRTVSG